MSRNSTNSKTRASPRTNSKAKPVSAQSQRFINSALELECADDVSAADALMGRLASMPPEPRKAKGGKPEGKPPRVKART